ncbi:MAG TPA: stage II sporulation protein M [Chitinophagaceae bacterium]|nr:stage II sporulation protein M [Chitinophagaceae bacterium]
MREALFIKKHKEKWAKAQQMPPTDADEMANNFTELVNDLAYAKTFYPTSKVTQYINGQASKIYLNIYRNRKEESNRIVDFWKYDLPLTIYKYRKVIFFMFIFFCVFFIVGFFSTRQDENFARQVLDDSYVNETIENIEKGDPFGVYKHGNSFLSWMGIMINNIRVALVYFAEGILFGIFTVRDLMRESIRLGAFYDIFFSRGLGLQWALAVLIHGMLELWSIILSGAAGVIFGMGFLFPGTVKRIESLKRAVKDGLKITVGILPALVVAAFFEGFVTRYYKMHWIFSSLILFSSATFIVWYFIIYPMRLQKKFFIEITEEA